MDLNTEMHPAGSPAMPEPLARAREASLRNVLLIEDSRVDARLVIGMLSSQGEGLQCTHVEKLADAIETLQTKHQDVVLLDLNLPDSSGYDTFFNIFRAATILPGSAKSGRRRGVPDRTGLRKGS